jgi:Uma2 family endonuclease
LRRLRGAQSSPNTSARDGSALRASTTARRVHDATLVEMDPEIFAGERLRPLTRREYDELVDLGWFEGEPIELLRGMLVEMTPQGGEHSDLAAWFAQQFSSKLAFDKFDIRAHSPYAATDDSEPEPVVQISRKPKPHGQHPTSALLVIEV